MYEQVFVGAECDEMMESLVHVFVVIICKQSTLAIVKTNLERLIRPLAIQMLSCVSCPEVNETVCQVMHQKTKMLSFVFNKCEELEKHKEANPIIPIYTELAPLLLQGLRKFQLADNVIEYICTIVKHAMRSLKSHFLPFMSDFASLVLEQYLALPKPTMLYCAEFSASVFGTDPRFADVLRTLFDTLGRQTFLIIGKTGYTDQPHLAEDFFGMCVRYVKYCPQLVFGSTILKELLEFAIALVGFEHIGCAKALYLFLEHLFKHYQKKESTVALEPNEMAAFEFVVANGPPLARKLILIIEAGPPDVIAEYVNAVLVAMLVAIPGHALDWLSDAIQLVPPSAILFQVSPDCLTRDEKTAFKAALGTRESKIVWSKLEYLAMRGVNKAKRSKR